MKKVKQTITGACAYRCEGKIIRRFALLRLFILLGITSGSLLCIPVSAATRHYHIEQLPLADALTRFAEQADLQIIFQPENMPAISVEPVTGDYTADEILKFLLRNTSLNYMLGGNGVVIIQPQVELQKEVPFINLWEELFL